MNRMSLERAKMVIRNRGYFWTGDSRRGYRVYNGRISRDIVNGRSLVKFAKQVLDEEEKRNKEAIMEMQSGNQVVYDGISEEIMCEMRSMFGPGTTVVDVITGERVTV